MTKKDFNYQQKSRELEDIVAQLQDPAIQIDEATKLHTAGLKLIGELEAYLEQAEVEVRRHVAQE